MKTATKSNEYTLVSDYKWGYRNLEDVTNLVPGVMITGSQNVFTNVSSRIEARKGYVVDGQVNNDATPITASFDWDTMANGEDFEDETEEERTRRIIKEELAQSKIQQIDTEKEMLLKKLARENKELKLANLNKTGTPVATVGTHSEGTPVTDTSVTPEQLAAFKAKGWTDKDIERYKGNLRRYSGR